MSTLDDAREALLGGDLANAQAIAADLLKTDPDNAGAWYVLGEAVEGDRKEIFQKKALTLNPDIASEFAPDVSLDDFADDFLIEDSAEDDVMSLGSSDFPSLSGPVDDDSDEFVSETAESTDDDSLDDFYVEPVNDGATDDDSDVSSSDESADSATGSGFDTSLILLAGIGLMIVFVLYMLIQSL